MNRTRRRPAGFTLIEVLVGLTIVSVLIGVTYGIFYYLFGARSRHNVTALARRSFMQKDAKAGLRRMIYRLRESIQILDPQPGQGGSVLRFKDILNRDTRIRLDPNHNRLVSEQLVNGAWTLETDVTTLATPGGSQQIVTWPVLMANCSSVQFTTLSPECVALEVRLTQEAETTALMTTVKLRNVKLAQ